MDGRMNEAYSLPRRESIGGERVSLGMGLWSAFNLHLMSF